MKKRILIPSIAALVATSLVMYQVYNLNITKETIKKQVITEINTKENEKSNYITVPKLANQINSNRMIGLDTSYLISINTIYNEKLRKTEIDGSNYLSYNFDAEVTFSKNKKTYTRTINSSVIVEKENNSVQIKSVDDLEQDLIKALIQIKKENSEDFSEELNTISLVYQNEELGVQINYPDYYTYSTLKTQNENSIEYNVSFYMDNDKSSNYIQFLMLSDDSRTRANYIEELKKQGYTLKEKKLTAPNNIEFSILTQSFTQNLKDVTEIIYVSNSKYKDIDNLIITAKLDSSLLKTRESEIEEIIKSLK